MNHDDLLNVIASRHCTRSFNSNPVDLALIKKILEAAKNAPSSQNNQPWRCFVLSGNAIKRFSSILVNAKEEDKKPDYVNRPIQLTSNQQKGIDAYGKWWFEDTNHLKKDDLEGRKKLYTQNYLFWGAPIHIIVAIPANAVSGTFLDIGCFIQNILLGCHAVGLGAVPQFSVASFAPLIRKFLGIENNEWMIVCGISVGYGTSSVGPPRLDGGIEWLNE